MRFRNKTIYLDHAAATPLDKKVALAMEKYSTDGYANPSAIHTLGVHASHSIDTARSTIANMLNAHADEIVFTGSATESDALAILGVARACSGEVPHIVTTTIEHPAVLENCKLLEMRGEATVTYVPVEANGIVDPKKIRDALQDNTVLVTVMYANNEIGTIQPIREIAKEIRHWRKQKDDKKTNQHSDKIFPFFHTDATQAINYLEIENVDRLGVDLMTFNSAKIYGPKGLGILYKKRNVVLAPVYGGGGQEQGLRPGTLSAGIILGATLSLARARVLKHTENERLTTLRNYGIQKISAVSRATGYTIVLNGDTEERLPNNINITIEGISSELVVIELDAKKIYISERSACAADADTGSHVIRALREAQGIPFDVVSGSLRISLGRSTTKRDIDVFIATLEAILKKYSAFKI